MSVRLKACVKGGTIHGRGVRVQGGDSVKSPKPRPGQPAHLYIQHPVYRDGHVVLCDCSLVTDGDGQLLEGVNICDAVHLPGEGSVCGLICVRTQAGS